MGETTKPYHKVDFIKPVEERSETERGSSLYQYFDMIQIPELQQATAMVLNGHSNEELVEQANKVAKILIALLKEKNLVGGQGHQSFVDVLLSATLMHNVFYEEENWVSLFWAREETHYLFEEVGVPEQVSNAIFQTIEAQLGEKTPVPLCKPQPNSPTELFSFAVWFDKYMRQQ